MDMPANCERQLFGLCMHALTLDEVLDLCRDALLKRRRLLIGVLNAAKVVKLRHDPLLRRSLLEADVRLADGQSVVWASRILRQPLPTRVAGIDLFEALLQLAVQQDRSVYLLGARTEVLSALVAQLERRYPTLRISGSRDGYFTDAEAADVAADIRDSGTDMLFLGMVSPKKENFLARWGDSLDVPVLHGVGGSFDVLAGVSRRAPSAWQRAGMEWAFRLIQEPRRMWKRYLTTNTAFVALTLHELVRPTPSYEAAPFAAAPPS